MKNRSPDQTVVSISLPKELLARIDARAGALGLRRSQYLARLAKTDVERGGAFMIEPEPAPSPTAALDPEREVAVFLELAVPALENYDLKRDDPQTERPESLAENEFWSDFLDERQEILDLKWIESKKAGRDIGYRDAIRMWMQHRPGWLAAQHPDSG